MSAAYPHTCFTDERDSLGRHCRHCRLRVSFQGKRPHVVGAACGQVCGPRSILDGKPGLSNSDPLGRAVAVVSASLWRPHALLAFYLSP